MHFLGFLWPNRDFSTGYGNPNKKICSSLNSRSGLQAERLKQRTASARLGYRQRQIIWQNICSTCFWFWQENASGQMPQNAPPHFGRLGLSLSSRENLETGRDQTPSPLCRSGAQFRCIFSRFGSVSVRFYAIKCRLISEFWRTPACGRAGSIRILIALRDACLSQAFDHALVLRVEGRIVASV